MFWRKTVRSMKDEFGPLPAERWPELARYSDAELMERDLAEVIAEIETRRAAARRRSRTLGACGATGTPANRMHWRPASSTPAATAA